MSDNLQIFGTVYDDVTGIIATDTSPTNLTYIKFVTGALAPPSIQFNHGVVTALGTVGTTGFLEAGASAAGSKQLNMWPLSITPTSQYQYYPVGSDGQELASITLPSTYSTVTQDISGYLAMYSNGDNFHLDGTIGIAEASSTDNLFITCPYDSALSFSKQLYFNNYVVTTTLSQGSLTLAATSNGHPYGSFTFYKGLPDVYDAITVEPIPDCQTYYMGSSVPSSSFGENLDLYLLFS